MHPISGVVRHHEAPVANAVVIAYNLGNSTLVRMKTASDGTFVLASAPAGVYELIAYKRGFIARAGGEKRRSPADVRRLRSFSRMSAASAS